jgi:hypothetical protein
MEGYSMLRLLRLVRNVSIMAFLPIFCGAIALAAPASGNSGRTLTSGEMSRSYGGTDYVDMCLKDAPGCSDLDDYWTYYAMCVSNSTSGASCGAAPAGIYNYGLVNTKGCEKALTPATGNVTCIDLEDENVCAYFTICQYSQLDMGMMIFSTCVPAAGTVGFWSPMAAWDFCGT